jgi:NadR type nicotinamide-nucleotide adenylyltransferase
MDDLAPSDATRVTQRPPLRVVVTGAPCTGKTTLAAQLAARFGVPWSPEFARLHQAAKPELLDASDVEPIARGQIEAERLALVGAERLVLHDTDLLSTVVYSRHYYGACPEWVVRAADARRADLYLLLHPDVPWTREGLQRDETDTRVALHALFQQALTACGARQVDIRGAWEERERAAAAAVATLLADASGCDQRPGGLAAPGSRSTGGLPE